jgi:DNA helicase-2/ATP-dependent DNA helicase PcrA
MDDAPLTHSTVERVGDDLLDDLTPPQVEAVTHVDGPMLVLAGPGSGKTRVITRRVAHLVLGVGIPPWNILAITFTNKAAGEMQQRVASLVSARQARAVTVCTFHSLCARILRQFADRMGLPPGFSIYDTADQQRAVKSALEDLEINSKNFPPGNMLSSISSSKNELIGPDEFARNYANDFHSRTVAKVYRKYDETLRRNNAVDFDDLLLKVVQLFREQRDVLEQLQNRWQYVLIDEYQDTNHAQFMLASVLAARYKNICATGDPDQSIYGWRGANIRNILEFENHYPDAKVVRLEQNYRSTQHILTAADALIRNNKRRKHKELFTTLGDGDPVKVLRCRDERHEAKMVVERFQDLHNTDGVAWGSMAVFYRMNSLSRVMEDALRDAGIPYQIARGTAFYERAEIKNTIAYLRAVVNPADEVAVLRIINVPARGISDKSVKAMQAFALANNLPVVRVIDEPMKLTALTTRAQASVARFAQMLRQWRHTAGLLDDDPPRGLLGEPEPSLRSFVERVMRESGLEDLYRNDKADPDQERLANLGEFITFTQQFEEEYVFEREAESEDGATPSLAERLLAFLERISLISDVDSVDPETGAVTLMTLHAAKGLEYHAVAMIGVEDGLLPHERARHDDHELEEERRLCFVGITRAMRRLLMCHAKYRTVFGQTLPTIPSRFLGELPDEVVEQVDLMDDGDSAYEVENESRHQRSLAHRQAGEYPPGTLVRHPQFGLGRVVQVSAAGMHTRATIDFNTSGAKTLILQYARLERADPA